MLTPKSPSLLHCRALPVLALAALVAALAATAVAAGALFRHGAAPPASATAPAVHADPLTVEFAVNWVRARGLAVANRKEVPPPPPAARCLTCMVGGVPARILEFATLSDAMTWCACPSSDRGPTHVELGTV